MQRRDSENTVRVHFLSGLADHLRECYGVRSCMSIYRSLQLRKACEAYAIRIL